MFTARLVAHGKGFAAQLVDTLRPDAVAPPTAQ